MRQIVGGGQTVEACPAWCAQGHATDRRGLLDDLTHVSAEVATVVSTFDHWQDGAPVSLPMPILRASIRVDPYSENPRRNVPHVLFEPWMDEGMAELTPAEFAAVIAQIRAHCNQLDAVLAQLVQARAEHPSAPTPC